MNIWNITISSWWTIVPIDNMRTISNKSGWHTWARLAEQFLQEWHSVRYVQTWNGVLPFLHPLQKNPLHVQDTISPYQEIQEHIKWKTLDIVNTSYFDEYKDVMVDISKNSKLGDVAIIAAAVSDYGMKQIHEWKISSSEENLSLALEKLPKVIDLMRQVSSKLVMIGFKLLPIEDSREETYEKLVHASLKQMNGTSQTDLVVANSSTSKANGPGIGIQDTLIVHPDGNYEKIHRRHLFEVLNEKIPSLIKKRQEYIQ